MASLISPMVSVHARILGPNFHEGEFGPSTLTLSSSKLNGISEYLITRIDK